MKNIRRIVHVLAALEIALLFASCATTARRPQPLDSPEALLLRMTTEEKVAQLFVICPEQLTDDVQTECTVAGKDCYKLSKDMKEFLARYPAGGFVLFKRHMKNKKQLKALTSQLAFGEAIPPMIAVDEEGGRVTRLAKTDALKIAPVGAMGMIGATGDVQQAYNAGAYIGGYLAEYGFTLDFAPVVDVNTNPENIVIGDRAFGSEPLLVAEMAGAFLDGLHSKGIRGCIKHFPGHGDTKADTHADFVAVEKSWDELSACELVPFVANFGSADCIMVAHVTLTNALTEQYPASLSRELITDKLRGELGYDGVVITDALDMGAIVKNFGTADAALRAFKAGADVLLMPQNYLVAYKAVLGAVERGRISRERLDESVLRILRLKSSLAQEPAF